MNEMTIDEKKIQQAITYLRQHPYDCQAAIRQADQNGDHIDARQWETAIQREKKEREI